MKRVLAIFIAIYSITGFGQTITVIDDEKGYPVKGAAVYKKNLSISIAVVGGTVLGPLIYTISTEWALLFAGLIAGTVAFLFGGTNGK